MLNIAFDLSYIFFRPLLILFLLLFDIFRKRKNYCIYSGQNICSNMSKIKTLQSATFQLNNIEIKYTENDLFDIIMKIADDKAGYEELYNWIIEARDLVK